MHQDGSFKDNSFPLLFANRFSSEWEHKNILSECIALVRQKEMHVPKTMQKWIYIMHIPGKLE